MKINQERQNILADIHDKDRSVNLISLGKTFKKTIIKTTIFFTQIECILIIKKQRKGITKKFSRKIFRNNLFYRFSC